MNKKLAHQAQAKEGIAVTTTPKKQKERDDVNWFGVKIGTDNSIFGTGTTTSNGVGKYLNRNNNNKRARDESVTNGAQAAVVDEDNKKKRKTGFGDFEGW